MPKVRLNLEGVTMTGLYLTVHFTRGTGSAKRLEAVKVPWEAFLDTEIHQHLNRAEVERLKRHWGSQDDELPPW